MTVLTPQFDCAIERVTMVHKQLTLALQNAAATHQCSDALLKQLVDNDLAIRVVMLLLLSPMR